jgi:uncharacterized protein YggU (UPF0235/DUF167 family)
VSPVRLTVRVQPGAKQAGLVGFLADGALKLKVAAPALEGRANLAVEALLAGALGLRKSQVHVARGAGSRTKQVEFEGITRETLDRRLAAALGAGGQGSPERE